MSVLLTVLLGAALAPAADAPAVAPDRIEVIRRVKTSDLDLVTASGRQILDKRILNAVQALCPRDTRTGLISGNRDRKECLEAAMNGAARDRDQLLADKGVSPDYRTADRSR
jgi:UrcA family protein